MSIAICICGACGYVYVSVFVCIFMQYCVCVYMYCVGGSVLGLWVLFLFTLHYVCTVRKGEMGCCGNSLSSETSRPQALSRVLRGPFPVQVLVYYPEVSAPPWNLHI